MLSCHWLSVVLIGFYITSFLKLSQIILSGAKVLDDNHSIHIQDIVVEHQLLDFGIDSTKSWSLKRLQFLC